MIRWYGCLTLATVLAIPIFSFADVPGLRVPPGFEITEFADGKLAADIYCLTVNPKGRVVVSGPGYIRLLCADGEGKANRVLDFAAAPKDGAMGLHWDGDDLYCVGGGGLRVYRNAGGKGRTKPSSLLFRCRTGGEHDAHAIGRGPDGWFYLLAGNNTGIKSKDATLATSPIKEPIAGCVLRFPPDFKGCEIVADGFRNAYGMDWNAEGDLFTFDSDNERCVSLPWYEPTRLYHVQVGGHYGWRNPQQTMAWRFPPYFLDVVAPAATLGRGSPTGVACYKHSQFPARYRGGLFLLDWTFGQIHFVSLKRKGSSYEGVPEVFLKPAGDEGFAPTAAAVDPTTGDLYVAIGGRGTRGAVYRIRYAAGRKGAKAVPLPVRSLDWRAGLDKQLVRDGTSSSPQARRRALDLAWRHRDRLSGDQLEQLIRANAGQIDRGLRQATAHLLAALPESARQKVAKKLISPAERITRLLAMPGFTAAKALPDRKQPPGLRLDAVRLIQLMLGGISNPKAKGTVWEGYTQRKVDCVLPSDLVDWLAEAFPSGDAALDRELSRTLAMVSAANPSILAKTADMWKARSDPVEDIHYLAVLARLRGKRTAKVTRKTSEALISLDAKLTKLKRHRDTNWPLRVGEILMALVEMDANLNAALLTHPDFGRPDHALLAGAPGFDRKRAAERFLARAAEDREFAWNADLVKLVGELPEGKSLSVLRKLWGQQGLDDAILPALARHAKEKDRARFIQSLGNAQSVKILIALNALERLGLPSGPAARDELLALIKALRLYGVAKETAKTRVRLINRLQRVSGQKLEKTEAWRLWFSITYPALADQLTQSDGVDRAAWAKRLKAIDWSKGDPKKGKPAFHKASCAACHSGSAALGPDLSGAAGRFSRDDLFTAILQPSKDISPRYRTTQLTTANGKTYQGIIAYEAVDSILLLTGPGQSVRLAHKQITERRMSATSLMPAGLIDRLTDREIADLYAYLKSLTVLPGKAS
jgi:putative heme-binding domain-containing protein